MLAEYGVSTDAMAQRSGVSHSFVYYALNLARQEATEHAREVAARAGAGRKDAPVADAPSPRKPRKISEGTLLRRAYDAIRNVRAFKGLLDAETREF